jgi:hypothetical protein
MAIPCEPAVNTPMPNSTSVSPARRPTEIAPRGLLIVLVVMLLVGCSGQPRKISGEPPAITLDSMMIEDSAAAASACA